MMLKTDNIWKIIEVMLKNNRGVELIKHHLESYELFVEKYVLDIIKENSVLKVKKAIDDGKYEYEVSLTNPSYGSAFYTDANGKINLLCPRTAHNKSMTYSMPLYVDVRVKVRVTVGSNTRDEEFFYPKETLGMIPVMKGSKYCTTRNNRIYDGSADCEFDKGGYFIVKGNDKVIVLQERMVDNQCFFFKHKDKKHSHRVEVRSNSSITQMASVLRVLFLSKDGIRGKCTLEVLFVNLKKAIPLLWLFAYYGATTDKEIVELIFGDSRELMHLLKPSLEEFKRTVRAEMEKKTDVDMTNRPYAYGQNKKIAHTERDYAIERLISRNFTNTKIHIDYVASQRILPHIKGQTRADSHRQKLEYLGYMTKKLLYGIHEGKDTVDRDSFSNKRIETTGILMGQLFRKLYKDTLSSLKSTISKDSGIWKPIKSNIFRKSNITNRFVGSLATGIWDSKISSDNKKAGVAQMLKRLTYSATISHLRRINSPINKTGKLVDPRKLHNTQYMYCCPAESPEGHQIGLIKNLSLSTLVSTYSSPDIIFAILSSLPCFKPSVGNLPCESKENEEQTSLKKEEKYDWAGFPTYSSIPTKPVSRDDVIIFVNGTMVGTTRDPHAVVHEIKRRRRAGRLNYMVSVSYKPNERDLHVHTDEGRLIRPLLVVQNNKLNIRPEMLKKIKKGDFRFIELLNNGIIEYIDPHETETIMIAKDQKVLNSPKGVQYSHCEIHGSLIFGICASLIPFPQHNQAPRVLYQCAQGKQAIGFNSTEVLTRMDTINHILHHPQRPIVYTRASDIIGMNDIPAGANLIVAIATFGAYNIEDSVIVNKAAIDRGMFHITSYKTYKTETKKDQSALSEEIFCIPDKTRCIDIRMGSYEHLGKDGIVKIGSKVKGGDVIVGKMTPILGNTYSSKKNIKYKDTSVQLKQSEHGIVDKILITDNIASQRIAKIRIRTTRVPEIADKCSSRHGQKSTVGMILPEEDMPFTEQGIVPDIIINPHCLPSRMTIGQVIECMLGKIGAIDGKFIDGTPFQDCPEYNNLDAMLEARGFSGSGKETLINGETGDRIETEIFIGPTYYQRLKHMVSDKIHARAGGPVNKLTHQPTEGRSRGGGFRLGGMEVDCLHAHGLTGFIMDKMVDCSDKFSVHVCTKCKMIAHVNVENNVFVCNQCKSGNDFDQISLPYSSKLLLYELMGMGMTTKFETEGST